MECGMVGWSVGRTVACLVGWLASAVEAECIAGACRLFACVTYKRETACWGDTLLTGAQHTRVRGRTRVEAHAYE